VPLDADLVSHDPAKVRQITGLTDFREGLFMTKRAGTYHLTWSVDETGSENYRVGYAVVSDPLATTVRNKGVILSKRPGLGILGTGHHNGSRGVLRARRAAPDVRAASFGSSPHARPSRLFGIAGVRLCADHGRAPGMTRADHPERQSRRWRKW